MPDTLTTIDLQLDRAAQTCAGRGARLTDIRRAVLALIVASPAPMGAYTLLDRLRAEKANATPATIYRALDFLLQHELVHRIERLNAFIACSDQGAQHQHDHSVQFMICRSCGSVAETEDASIEQAISLAAQQAGFRPDTATVEIEGTCLRCLAGQRQ